MATSNYLRAKQWEVFARMWYIYDAKWQNPFHSSVLIAKILKGKHKPIYHPKSDVGDHVVVINTKHISMPGDEWRRRVYFHHTRYGGGKSFTPAWELHEINPTLVMWKAIYKQVGGKSPRQALMERLHCFPDDKVPPEMLANVSRQLRQLMPVPKRLDEYSKEEIDNFPKLFDLPQEFIVP